MEQNEERSIEWGGKGGGEKQRESGSSLEEKWNGEWGGGREGGVAAATVMCAACLGHSQH